MSARPGKIVGANAHRSRNHNRQVVLDQVRSAGQIGRAEIARASGLSTQAVSNIIADLLEDRLIVEGGRRAPARGLPVTQYVLNPTGGYAFGIEVRPDAIFAALLNLAGEEVFTDRVPIRSTAQDEILSTVVALKAKALAKAAIPADRILGAGVVMPGPFGATGIRDSGSELTGWEDAAPQVLFEEALELSTFVENDANAAAMAERVTGVAKARGLSSYAFVYFGTGVGLGVVDHGRLITGAFGNAGEIGHMIVPTTGGSAPLESLVSRLSAQRFLAQNGVRAASVGELATLHADRNPALLTWIDSAAAPLAAAIGTVENLFDPETVILGGAMPDGIFDHLIDAMALPERTVAHRPDRGHPRVLRGTSGRMTATLGAAALVINQTFTPKISVAG